MRETDRRALECLARGDVEGAQKAVDEGKEGFLGSWPAWGVFNLALRASLLRLDAAALDWVLSFKFPSSAADKNYAERPYLYDLTNSESFSRQGQAAFGGAGPWAALFESGGSMADEGFRACAERLLSLRELSLNAPLTIEGWSPKGRRPISQAAALGDEALVERLLEAGAAPTGHWPERASSPEFSPLFIALSMGRGGVAERLIKAGAGVSGSGLKGASALAAQELASAPAERVGEAKTALRLALKLEGAPAGPQGWGPGPKDPLSGLGALEAWLCRQALLAEGKAGAKEAPEPARPAGLLKALGWGRGKREAPQPAAALALAASPSERSAWRALLSGEARDLAEGAKTLAPRARQELLLGAWALAKAGYWRMPMKEGVADVGRDAASWACFKSLALSASPEDLAAPIKELGGLSLIGAASALGHADVCSALIQAKASLDADPMLEGAAPLALAARFGQSRLAMSLLDAGADPFEGIAPGAFGYPERGWAIHEALAAGEMELFERLLRADPEQAELKNPEGQSVRQLAEAGQRGAQSEAEQAHWARALRALRRARESQADGAEEPVAGPEPAERARPKGPR